MIHFVRFFLLAVCLANFLLPAAAQQTAVYHDPELHYKTGLDLFNKQKYGAAQKEFEDELAVEGIPMSVVDNASFYRAWCSALLFHAEAEDLFQDYLDQFPVSPNRQRAMLELARYFYQQKKYKKSIEWFEKTDPAQLSADDYSEYWFKTGYAWYKSNEYEKASAAFAHILETDSRYNSAANYYYAHIAYLNGNYETALKSFLRLKDSESFAPIAPYYITQIYYKQGKYDEVLKYAPSKLDTGATRNGLEIERMIAESHYHKGNYHEAIPYLQDYQKNSGGSTRTDDYVLAYCYYMDKQYAKAQPAFQKLTSGNDSLAQHAWYYLAGCYIASGDKRAARSALQSAGKLDGDSRIREEALFQYAKLSYELNYQSVAIESFHNFLKEYPNSAHAPEANELIVDVYSTSRNYKEALAAIESIRNKSPRILAAYQKAAYYRGLELMSSNQTAEAIRHFRIAIDNPGDARLEAAAHYWSGETYYKMGDYSNAVASYNNFVFTPAALTSPQYNLAQYNLGYALFKKEDYAGAQTAFRKYIGNRKDTDTRRFNDALLRIADAAFMQRNPAAALDFYEQAIQNKADASDYALYQKGLIQGIQGNMQAKITTLQRLLEKYPKSLYFDDALYEAATASRLLDKNDQALQYYRQIITSYPSSSYLPRAMLGEAQVYYNMQQDDRALGAFKNVIAKYPGTEQSREAMAQVRTIYVNQNKTDDFLAYAKTVPDADVSAAAQDSLVYESAELRYTQGNCDKAAEDFASYLSRFPEGQFAVNASYYRSDCLFRKKDYEGALPGFEYVINHPKSAFTEKSLLYAGMIQARMNRCDSALAHFTELEQTAEERENIFAAQVGQMRCLAKGTDAAAAQVAAQKVINAPNADKDIVNEAHLVNGKAFLAAGNMTDAKSELTLVAKRTNSEITAEAKYHLAVIEYKLENFKASEKVIFEIAKMEPGYDYWIAKGFILLGDNYLALKDTFQARETYKSILTHYEKQASDPDDLRAIARQKYDAITPVSAPETGSGVKQEGGKPEEAEEKNR